MADQVSLMLPTTPGEPPNGEYSYNELHGGRQLHAWYPNNYGASVVQSEYSYGGDQGLYELAVLHGQNVEDSDLCYATPVTGDVLGWLTEEDVIARLHDVAKLPSNDSCNHVKPEDWLPEKSEHSASIGEALESLLGQLTDHWEA